MVSKFNIRVYAIWMRRKKILISVENIDGFKMLKFPGGGLEPGEGLIQGLKRELHEELNIEIESWELLHVTEQFVRSRFRSEEQVIAVYYLVGSDANPDFPETIQTTSFGNSNHIRFEWKDLNNGLLQSLSFESDKEVIRKLLREINEVD